MGETLVTTLTGLATRIAARICAYTYAFYINRMCWDALKGRSKNCGSEPDNTHLVSRRKLPVRSVPRLINAYLGETLFSEYRKRPFMRQLVGDSPLCE